MSVEEHREETIGRLGFAVLTVSDSRDAESDRGGPLLVELARAGGHEVVDRRIVIDDLRGIRETLRDLLDTPQVDVVLVTGGTGVAARDVTVEAAAELFERELPGFGELFRVLSYDQIGAAAMLSRATAGVARGRAIFLLPGSPDALELAMRSLILPELGHLMKQVRG